MSKQDIIEQIRSVLKAHPYVVRAELFGSLARGEDAPGSDVDLLVVYDETRPKGFRSLRIVTDMEDALGRDVDVVQERLLHDCVRSAIVHEREVIYERQEWLLF